MEKIYEHSGVKMNSRAVTHEIPTDSQVALAVFRSLDATMLFIKGLPHNDMFFPDICMRAGATDVAGVLTMCWVKFPDPDSACYFATQMDKKNYRGRIISISAGRVPHSQGFKGCIQRIKLILAGMGVSLNYQLSRSDQ